MAITNFLNFTTNSSPLTGDFLVGFVNEPEGRGQYEYKTTFQTLFDAYGTYASALSGITPEQLSVGHPTWNAVGDLTVSGQLNANNSIIASSNISTTNGVIFSQGASNSVTVYDRNGSGTNASFFKVGGNNYLAGSTSGTVITYTSAGNVGIGTTAPNTTLTVVGSVSATGNLNVRGNILINNQLVELVPAGAIMTFAMSAAPVGWLPCDGRTVTTTGSGANLFAAIGYTYGGTGGNFNVPDLRGHFIRGSGTNTNGVSAGTFGVRQDQDWKSFTMTNTVQNGFAYVHNNVYMGKSLTSAYIGNLFTGAWNAPAAAIGTRWDNSEIRPSNVALLYCIKY